MAYAVFRSDLMSGTDVAADLVSVKYYEADAPAAIENGCVVKLGGLLAGEREVYRASAPEGSEALSELAVIGSPEVLYDERKKNLDEFVNEAGKAARGYLLRAGNVFSVTQEAFDGAQSPAVGNIVELADGG